jgi:hypothetical protein
MFSTPGSSFRRQLVFELGDCLRCELEDLLEQMNDEFEMIQGTKASALLDDGRLHSCRNWMMWSSRL